MPRIKGIKTKKVKDNKNVEHKKKIIKDSLYTYFKNHPEYTKELNEIINNKRTNNININLINWFIEEIKSSGYHWLKKPIKPAKLRALIQHLLK